MTALLGIATGDVRLHMDRVVEAPTSRPTAIASDRRVRRRRTVIDLGRNVVCCGCQSDVERTPGENHL
jgi:hypothetical protein